MKYLRTPRLLGLLIIVSLFRDLPASAAEPMILLAKIYETNEGKTFRWQIPTQLIKHLPKWDTYANPPLTVAHAVRNALQELKLNQPAIKKVNLRRISIMRPIDKIQTFNGLYLYMIEFDGLPKTSFDTIVVLMDGSIVKAEIE